MKKTLVFFLSILTLCQTQGQQKQLEFETMSSIVLETSDIALFLKVEENRDVNMSYLGAKLQNMEEYSQIDDFYRLNHDYTNMYQSAYTASGTRNLLEPAISVEHSDGNLSLDLKYVEHNIENPSSNIQHLKILLKDEVYPFFVELHYQTYYKENVIEQWAVIRHQEDQEVTLTKFASANLSLKGEDFYLKNYHGDWLIEMQPEETLITHGIKTIDSKLGTRTNLFQVSYFTVSLDQPSEENEGTVLMGGLDWSGNFKVDFEKDPQENLRIIAGINNYASHYKLVPNKDFVTPKFSYTLSTEGIGKGSRDLHDWARNYKLVNGNGERYTLLNNWESTFFDFDENKIFQLIKNAKDLGVDLFLLDDGWFGNKYPRGSDTSALGDWDENVQKLPNGIGSLVREADKNGVKFGVWLEPEMVSPKSELYENHPDWVVKQKDRSEHYFRNQLVLDMSNPEVQEFVYNTLMNLFTENPGLAYVKWDCNAVIYNAHSTYSSEQNNFYVDYVKGLYSVLERFREHYPEIPMMLCAGGGGRVDYGALSYFTEYWPSDNTEPLDRIYMQYENSLFFPMISSVNHVTSTGDQSLKFKIDVAMMGKMGFDINIEELDEEELAFAKQAVRTYDDIKNIVWHGDLYRLSNPRETNFASLYFVDKDKKSSVMFNYLTSYGQGSRTVEPIKLKGLNPDKKYKIEEINLYGRDSYMPKDLVLSGDFLMKVGINPILENYQTSVVLKITEE